MTPAEILDRIDRLFAERGALEYRGEAVTQLEHALQAATFAERDRLAPETIAAAMLHDIGHLLHGYSEDCADKGIDDRHEELGVRFLSRGFGLAITEPIRLHVAAKRYLTTTRPGYYDNLSPASIQSLELQGGPMTPSEVREFEAQPHFSLAIKVREYDDGAKVIGLITPPFAHFRKYLEQCIRSSVL
ncbi:MAG TPA: HD domain-containing protein [Gemmata sp.]|jgi:phosphonate degradation associated HDIG domain protein|nr:HD domain-containing protein [Gemmata sp.]